MPRPKGRPLPESHRLRIQVAMQSRRLALEGGDTKAFMRATGDLTREINARVLALASEKDNPRYRAAVDEAIGRVLLALGKAMGMTEISDHRAAAEQSRALRIRASQARNTLQGARIADTPAGQIVPMGQTSHEPFVGIHAHMHPAYGASDSDDYQMHIHAHYHMGDAVHSPSRQPDHDAGSAH
jgi:hypothetical protein